MATKIVTKNSSTASAVPTASDLVQGELAVNVADKRLFTEDNAGAIVELGTNPSGNVTFQDNGKAIFGAGSDLQIYHDGSNSYITDTTGGNFFINDDGAGYLMMKGSDLYFRNPSNADMLHAQSGGFVKLYHNGVEKLATTSTGIDVTGTATMDGLNISNASGGNVAQFTNVSSADLNINLTSGVTLLTPSTGILAFGTSNTERVRIDSSGNVGIGTTSPSRKLDVNGSGIVRGFLTTYGAGVNNALFLNNTAYEWAAYTNASNNFEITDWNLAQTRLIIDTSGNVGIGTSSPSEKLHIQGDGADILLTDAAGGQTAKLGATGSNNGLLELNNSAHVGTVFLNSSGDSYLNGGNVGIGTSSPSSYYSTTLVVDAPAEDGITVVSPTTGVGYLMFADGTSGNDRYRGYVAYSHDTDEMQFATSGLTRMRIDSAGSVLSTGNITGNGVTIGASDIRSSSNILTLGGTTERMRIDSAGNLLVGTTSQTAQLTVNNGGNNYPSWLQNSSSSVDYPNRVISSYATGGQTATMFLFLAANGDMVGSVKSTVTATTYNTSSDQRLKENIADADDAGSKIDAIQVRQYDWKVDGSHQDYGMIAQELQAVAPEAVSGDADSEDMMGVDYSKLVPMLIKEIQSLRNRVAQLEE